MKKPNPSVAVKFKPCGRCVACLTSGGRACENQPNAAKPNPLERDRQAQIIKYLFLRFPGAVIWRHHAAVPGRRLAKSKKGMPDVFMLYNGTLHGFECKRPGEKQSEDQKTFQLKFEKQEGRYAVVHDVDGVIEALKGWRV